VCCNRAEYDLFQVELSKNYGVIEWRDDLKKLMLKAGLENVPLVFLFSDTQVTILVLSILLLLSSQLTSAIRIVVSRLTYCNSHISSCLFNMQQNRWIKNT